MLGQRSGAALTELREAIGNSVLIKLPASLPRKINSNSAVPFPQLSQVSADCDGRLHVLDRDPFERAVRVVLTAEQVRGRQAQFGKARAIGAATDGVVIGFYSSGRKGLASQLNRAHILA